MPFKTELTCSPELYSERVKADYYNYLARKYVRNALKKLKNGNQLHELFEAETALKIALNYTQRVRENLILLEDKLKEEKVIE